MMYRIIFFFYKIVPFKKQYVFLIKKLFPNYYLPNFSPEGYMTIEDPLSRKHIWMYMRKDSYMEKEFFGKGLYADWEKESLKIWAELCKTAKHILDIGANTGVYSLIAKAQNPASNVYAIEPIDINYAVLSKNIKKNKFNVNTEKIALSDKDGISKMFMLKDQLNYMTSIGDNRYEKHPEIIGSGEVVEIDIPTKNYKYVQQKYKIPKMDLIKIDVEGHEISVLNGMLEYIKQDRPSILLEIIGDENAATLDQMFKGLGYKFLSIDEVNKSREVDKLWDNDHHNFLICDGEIIESLKAKGLVQ